MSEARLCPYCFAGTPAQATHCWMCRCVIPPFELRAPLATRHAQTDDSGFVIWMFTSLFAMATMFTIVVVLFMTYPGIGVLAAAACLPIIGALAAMLYRNRPGARDRNETGEIVGTVLFGVAAVFLIMLAFILVIVAIFVLVCILCLGVVMVNQ